MKQVAPPNYTQIPNEIIDKWMRDLSGLQFKIIICICRKTFGWHKDKDKISVSQLEEMTGSSWRRMFNAVKDLEKVGMITVTRTSGKASEFSIKVASIETTPDKMSRGLHDKMSGVPIDKMSPTKESFKETLQKKKEGEADASTLEAPVNGRFKRPTLETLRQYFVDSIKLPPTVADMEAPAFLDHFDACGWVVGRDKPMKDWKAAARTWDRRRKKFGGAPNAPKRTGLPLEERIARAKKREEEIWQS